MIDPTQINAANLRVTVAVDGDYRFADECLVCGQSDTERIYMAHAVTVPLCGLHASEVHAGTVRSFITMAGPFMLGFIGLIASIVYWGPSPLHIAIVIGGGIALLARIYRNQTNPNNPGQAHLPLKIQPFPAVLGRTHLVFTFPDESSMIRFLAANGVTEHG